MHRHACDCDSPCDAADDDCCTSLDDDSDRTAKSYSAGTGSLTLKLNAVEAERLALAIIA